MMYVVDSHQNVVRRIVYRRMFDRIRSIRIRIYQNRSDWIRSDRIYRRSLILPLAKVSDKGLAVAASISDSSTSMAALVS